MPGIIEGYTYDIFISYRQNDNKYDGWVTEFVNNLTRELDANIKDKVSVYFDINPTDGLLETDSVDKSLEEKLKCLIFIPIISRTYCDPKSFAWQHEFCAFNKLAKEDRFGRDIKLASGNIAGRILPVKIHDLDPEDKTLIETELEGVLRGIEFIYKEAGVDRPLTPKDNEEKNLNKTSYRNQINKVALAIKEIVAAIKRQEQEPEPALTNTSGSSVMHGKDNRMKILIGSVLTLLLIVFGILVIPKLLESSEELEKSIAVLPFVNLSSDEDKIWFTDGITDIIINQLSKISDFRVLGWTSTQKYKEEKKSISDIGKELGVNYLIEGTIQRVGEKMRISVQLIRVVNEGHIWSDIYDREWKDIFEVQSEIAQKIAGELKAALTPEEKTQIEKSSTKDPEAYNLCLQGRYFWNKRGEANLNLSKEYFEKALAHDPDYALAYSGLADVYLAQTVNHIYKPVVEGLAKAEEMALKAIELDDNIVEPHNTLGTVLFIDMKWEDARKEFLAAIELNPDYSETYYCYAQLLDVLRQNKEARIQIDKAIKLNPFQWNYLGRSGQLYYNEGKFNESINEYLKTLELYPEHPVVHDLCFYAYFRLGENLKALESFQKQIMRNYNDTLGPKYVRMTREIYDNSGINGILNWRIERNPEAYFSNAGWYAMLGKKDLALDCLEKASENPPLYFFRINNSYDFNSLHSAPGFQAIIKKMGLSDYQVPN